MEHFKLHYREIENGHHFININCMEHFKLQTPQRLDLQFSDANGISALAIMKKLKNSCRFVNINHTRTI